MNKETFYEKHGFGLRFESNLKDSTENLQKTYDNYRNLYSTCLANGFRLGKGDGLGFSEIISQIRYEFASNEFYFENLDTYDTAKKDVLIVTITF